MPAEQKASKEKREECLMVAEIYQIITTNTPLSLSKPEYLNGLNDDGLQQEIELCYENGINSNNYPSVQGMDNPRYDAFNTYAQAKRVIDLASTYTERGKNYKLLNKDIKTDMNILVLRLNLAKSEFEANIKGSKGDISLIKQASEKLASDCKALVQEYQPKIKKNLTVWYQICNGINKVLKAGHLPTIHVPYTKIFKSEIGQRYVAKEDNLAKGEMKRVTFGSKGKL